MTYDMIKFLRKNDMTHERKPTPVPCWKLGSKNPSMHQKKQAPQLHSGYLNKKTKQVFSLLKQIHPNSAWCCRASSLFKDKKATLKIVLSVRDVRLDTCQTPIVQMKVHLIGIPDPFKMFHVILVVTIASWRGLFFPRYDIPLYCLVNRDPYFTVFFIIPT